MKIGPYCSGWMAPWRECELCFIGPFVISDGDEVRFGVGLFFIEVGIVVEKNAGTQEEATATEL